METWDAIRARRNVRDFAHGTIAPRDLDRILEAARRSPSSKNTQRWDFVAVVDPERLERLSHAWIYGDHLARAAAAIAFVAPATDVAEQRESNQFDMGQAVMSAMLAAADLGVGSCHSAVGDQALVRELLDLPENRECVVLISLGYPAARPLAPVERPSRKPFDDVVHRETW